MTGSKEPNRRGQSEHQPDDGLIEADKRPALGKDSGSSDPLGESMGKTEPAAHESSPRGATTLVAAEAIH